MNLKLTEISNILTDIITQCECNFSLTHFSSLEFKCFESSPNYVTILGSFNIVSSMCLISTVYHCLEEFFTLESSVSIVGDVLLINKMCEVLVSSVNSSECAMFGETELTSRDTKFIYTLVGSTISVSFLVMLCLLSLGILCISIRWRLATACSAYTTNHQ